MTSLQYAAEHGHGFALWQLGRMYAEGDGVKRDDYRAFEYFQKFADSHADDNPAIPRARFVANAFVALGHYYLEGIPNTSVTREPRAGAAHVRPRRLLLRRSGGAVSAGASLYLDGNGVAHDAKRAVPWLVLAANKGHYKSQALLGRILFNGEHGMRQRASGLMWLTVACDGPGRQGAVDCPVARERVPAGQRRRARACPHPAQALGRGPARIGPSARSQTQAGSIARST